MKQCRKDVGKGYEKYEKEICIVNERKSAVKEAGMGATAGLMGWMKRHKRGFGGEKEMQIERRSLSVYGGLKPHVSA